ncbi:MAG: hypothetical protein AMJ88_16555 [Anaerolineae bacterium SM23_ 63]|nr:MAG: hypothetical protein AMJ88_16555 [Anaerolineae bacterium SM23_ 63]
MVRAPYFGERSHDLKVLSRRSHRKVLPVFVLAQHTRRVRSAARPFVQLDRSSSLTGLDGTARPASVAKRDSLEEHQDRPFGFAQDKLL